MDLVPAYAFENPIDVQVAEFPQGELLLHS
jgi:hypothetical protein